MSVITDTTDRLSVLSEEELESLEADVHFYTTRQGTELAFHEYGDPTGRPILFYHGSGSHVHGMLLHKPALEFGFRIIAPDRPGVAQSAFREEWTLLDYAHDMADLADALGLDTFGAIGISGGGPTLYASAYTMPERLRCVVALACAAPVYADPEMTRQLGMMDRVYAKLGTSLPLAVFKMPFSVLGITQRVMKSPQSFAKMFRSSLCEADMELFDRPEFQYLIMRDFQELFRNGSTGPAYDAQTIYRPWGFDVSQIEKPMEIFHGTADKFVPISFSEYVANRAKNAEIHPIEGQGHFYHLAYSYQLLEKVDERYYS